MNNAAAIVPIYEYMRMIFIFLDIFLLGFFIFLIFKSWKFIPHFNKLYATEKVYTLGNIILKERWESILGRSRIDSAESMRHAIIDADAMIDELLERLRIQGANMSERLDNVSTDDFASLGRLSAAHKVRNKIVHEPDFVISHDETQRTIADYGSFLKEIGVID